MSIESISDFSHRYAVNHEGDLRHVDSVNLCLERASAMTELLRAYLDENADILERTGLRRHTLTSVLFALDHELNDVQAIINDLGSKEGKLQ